jgi:hypothetical protein
MEKLKILVGGYIGLYPTGGATWDYLQYVLGLKLLGHDVFYIEDTMQYPVYQISGDKWDDCSYGVNYLKRAMEEIDLPNNWAYRDVGSGQVFGMSDQNLKKLCQGADVFINVSGSTWLRDEYLKIPVRILIDTDPMFTQYQYHVEQEKGGKRASDAKEYMNAFSLLFTFGLNIGNPDCRIPEFGFTWHTTKKPTCIAFWEKKNTSVIRYGFTSIMNWVERPDFIYENETWGQKNKTFKTFLQLPDLSQQNFEIIISRPDNDEANKSMAQLSDHHWTILNGDSLISDKEEYKTFIQSSLAEFSITKETYIKSNSGWFSGRSACYLASGKPVITQDTKWTKYIPAGEGLFACNDLHSAVEAVRQITTDYSKHSRQAKAIAQEYFDSDKILGDILSKI